MRHDHQSQREIRHSSHSDDTGRRHRRKHKTAYTPCLHTMPHTHTEMRRYTIKTGLTRSVSILDFVSLKVSMQSEDVTFASPETSIEILASSVQEPPQHLITLVIERDRPETHTRPRCQEWAPDCRSVCRSFLYESVAACLGGGTRDRVRHGEPAVSQTVRHRHRDIA